jgi:hypothetical protein
MMYSPTIKQGAQVSRHLFGGIDVGALLQQQPHHIKVAMVRCANKAGAPVLQAKGADRERT